MTRLSDALTAYRICARAEGKSPRTIGWVMAVGPAGERLLRYAAVMVDGPLYRAFGRGGPDCVMGSNKLNRDCAHSTT